MLYGPVSLALEKDHHHQIEFCVSMFHTKRKTVLFYQSKKQTKTIRETMKSTVK